MANPFTKMINSINQRKKVKELVNDDLYLSEKELKKYKIKKTVMSILIYTFLTLVALYILLPFYWMFATALKSPEELIGEITFFPKKLRFENFKTAFTFSKIYIESLDKEFPGFLVFYGNTVLVAILTTIGTMVTTTLAAFAFARLNFFGRDTIFALLLATMMVPGEIFIITNYETISNLGLIDTYAALVLPFVPSVFYTFFLRQTFMQIPNELYLAAKVDGTCDFKYLIKVMIPMAKATLTTIFIISMMGAWNAYVWPNLVAGGEQMRLVSNGLMRSFSGLGPNNEHIQMAASALVSLPLLIAFIFLKKYIMRGVSRSGIKG